MSADLITAAVLAAPAALVGTVCAVAEWRDRPRQRAVARVLAESAAERAAARYDLSAPPPPGAPVTTRTADTPPAPATAAGTGAQIIAFPTRRAA